MKREGDYIKHPPPTLYDVESFSFVNILYLPYSLCLHLVSLFSLSLTHTHTHILSLPLHRISTRFFTTSKLARWTLLLQQFEFDIIHHLKKMLTKVPVVQLLDWAKVFHVFADASDIVVGSALMQLSEPKWYRAMYYESRKLSTTERNYSTTEREALDMIYSIMKFRHYLLGRKFTFHVNHTALLYLVSKQSLSGKLARWTL